MRCARMRYGGDFVDVIHGGDIYSARADMPDKRIIDFSANINPLGTPEKIKDAVRKSIDALDAYPDVRCSRFCRAAAEYHGVDSDFICAGNGAADIIFRLVHAVKPKTAAVCAPTFGEYEHALRGVGCEVRFYESGELEKCANGADMAFICNPNNPTGELTDGNYIENIVKENKNTLFVIDECFLDMTLEETRCSMISRLYLYPNIWVLKSLTKMYALAGLRIGYGICSDEKLCAAVRECGQPWAVSTASQAAGAAAFECGEDRREFLDMLERERGYLYGELKRLGFDVSVPTANFVFFRGAEGMREKLYKKGILIRGCGDYRGLDGGCYRVCVRTHEENKILVKALTEVSYG